MSWAKSVNKQTPTILFIDDNLQVLALKLASIERFKPEWNVISADSGNAAKELFKEHPQITHIVTDKNMRDGNAR
jgi:CheY-like chemotaxis protein